MPRVFPALLGTEVTSAGCRRPGFLRVVRGVREIRRVAMVSHRHDLAALEVAP